MDDLIGKYVTVEALVGKSDSTFFCLTDIRFLETEKLFRDHLWMRATKRWRKLNLSFRQKIEITGKVNRYYKKDRKTKIVIPKFCLTNIKEIVVLKTGERWAN